MVGWVGGGKIDCSTHSREAVSLNGVGGRWEKIDCSTQSREAVSLIIVNGMGGGKIGCSHETVSLNVVGGVGWKRLIVQLSLVRQSL